MMTNMMIFMIILESCHPLFLLEPSYKIISNPMMVMVLIFEGWLIAPTQHTYQILSIIVLAMVVLVIMMIIMLVIC